MKKTLRVLLILLAALVVAFGAWSAAQEVWLAKRQGPVEETTGTQGPLEDAASIRFVYPEFGEDVLEYEIDLDGQELRWFSSPDYKGRDPEAENGGWGGIEPLTEQEVSDIRRACAPMLQWEDYYEAPDVWDGWYWRITVTFRDGSTFQSGGHEAWPGDYWRVGEALREAGAEVLLPSEKPDWQESFT